MFIIADQRAAGVGGKRGLAGAGQAEENGGVAGGADVGRAVHRHHTLQRQQIVEDGEDRLLHLAGIGGAADQDGLAFEIHHHHGFAAAAVAGRIGLEAGQIDDGVFGHERRQIGQFRAHQQGADEQAVPGIFGDHAHLHPVFGLAAAKEILHEQVALALQRGFEIGLDGSELLRRDALVLVPPDGAIGGGIAHDELVVGAAAGVLAGFHHERAMFRQQALAALYGEFHQRAGEQVPVQGGGRGETLLNKAMGGHNGRRHGDTPLSLDQP